MRRLGLRAASAGWKQQYPTGWTDPGSGGGAYTGPIRHLACVHAFGITSASDTYDWMVNATPGRKLHQMSGDGAAIAAINPNAQRRPYTLGWTSVIDITDDLKNAWNDSAASWASANGKSLEGLFLHATAGATNYLATVSSISTAGVVAFGLSSAGRQMTTGRRLDGVTTAYAVGDSVVIAGNSNAALNGTWTVQAVTDSTHLTLNTTAGQTGTGGTISKTGDGTSTLANRVTFFKFDDWRHVLNAKGVDAQAWMAHRYTAILLATDAGWFIDESASGDLTSTALNSVEYGTGARATYATDLGNVYAAIRAANPGKSLVINISDYQSTDDQTLAKGALGTHCENLNSPCGYSNDQTLAWINTLRTTCGVTHLEFVDIYPFDGATPVAGVHGMPTSFINAGGHLYDTPDNRMKFWQYANYLLIVDGNDGVAKQVIWCNDNYAFTTVPQSARWRAGFENDLGQPTGAYTTIVSGVTDGAGITVKVYQRLFSRDGGKTNDVCVLLRRNYETAQGALQAMDSTTAYTVTLPAPPSGKAWHVLKPDGTTGTALGTTIDLWHVDAVILLAA